MGKQKHYFKGSEGFSILELVIAMALFTTALLGLMELQIQGHALVNSASLRTQALLAASSRKELELLDIEKDEKKQLLEIWENSFSSQIDGLIVRTTSTKNEALVLSLFWPSAFSAQPCLKEKEDEMDCLRF